MRLDGNRSKVYITEKYRVQVETTLAEQGPAKLNISFLYIKGLTIFIVCHRKALVSLIRDMTILLCLIYQVFFLDTFPRKSLTLGCQFTLGLYYNFNWNVCTVYFMFPG